jgi:octaprenyl-diphosphate synthase
MRTRSALESRPKEDLHLYMANARSAVESALERLLLDVRHKEIRPMLEYALLSGGKRLRPILVMLSAQSVGGSPEAVMKLSLSFELLHTATLVHDDIIDHDTLRRGTQTLCSRWSTDSAIVVGDALIALSVNLATDYGPEIMKILSNVGLELCEGEYIDASLTLEDATEENYFKKIEKKSASLFRSAACCGALAVEGDVSDVDALSRFGEYFGMIYQIRDDLKDILGADQISQDLKNGNVTLPFLHLYEHGDEHSRKLLAENFGDRNISASIAEEISKKMGDFGSFAYCEKWLDDYSRKSLASLESMRDSVSKVYLIQLSNHIVGSEV